MRWPPYKHVFFDCDSTLSTVEGIDVLAETAGKKWRVEVLTNAAMDGKLDLEDVYAKRLQAVRPTHEQIQQIRAAIGPHPLAIASGLTPENIAAYLPYANYFLVATGISRSFDSFDPARARAFVQRVRRGVIE